MASNNTMSILEAWSSDELVDLQRTNIKISFRTNNTFLQPTNTQKPQNR